MSPTNDTQFSESEIRKLKELVGGEVEREDRGYHTGVGVLFAWGHKNGVFMDANLPVPAWVKQKRQIYPIIVPGPEAYRYQGELDVSAEVRGVDPGVEINIEIRVTKKNTDDGFPYHWYLIGNFN